MDKVKLLTGLQNFRTRSSTIDAAVAAGTPAVQPALELLNHRNDGVRWSAIKILSALGDERAVQPLITLLAQGKHQADIVRALEELTGQNLGNDPEVWTRWQRGESVTPTADAVVPPAETDLLNAAIKDLPASFHGESPQYSVDVVLSDGRSQQIWVDFSQTSTGGDPLVQLCTPCAPADKKRYEEVLKLNMSVSFGAIALADLEGTLFFVMVDTHLRASVTPEELAHSLTSLASQGDAIEQALNGNDLH